ncbi:MAG TPA: response regulator [Gallionella sp.]|nr:response regulator [Gallionella sp.]
MTVPCNTAPLILFVDDETAAVKYFQRAIEAPVVTAGSVEEGKRLLDEHARSLLVVVSDQRMPGGCGNELLHYAQSRYPHMVRILTTAYSELERTVEAVNQGHIHRYLQKPWEIAALRLEMKQAIELADLRRERALLLREKLLVRQKQTLSNRICALHALCAGLFGDDDFRPLEVYLSAAAGTGGIHTPEPDGQLLDYAEQLSGEARRSACFGRELGVRLDEFRQRFQGWQGADGLGLLAETLGGQMQDDGSVLFPGGPLLAEFLDAPALAPVSPQHVSWLAFLLWLHGRGWSLQLAQQDGGVQCRLEQPAAPLSGDRLTGWIERFCEAESM